MIGTWRRLVPFTLLPLGLIAVAVASSPWLRAFPASTIAVPLYGAAILSVLVPVIVIGIGVRSLWQTALIDLAVFVFFTLLVGLRQPVGFAALYTGIAHGPSQILTFALPLVSPRTLLVAPLTLCWVCGAIVGEFIGRSWHSVLPYVALLVTFGLAYAGSVRGVATTSDGRRNDTLLAALLLLAMLLMRAVQAWVEQDSDAAAAQPDGLLPMRGLAIGALVSVVVTLLVALVAQSAALSGPPATPARVPPLDRSTPLSPLSFVAGLRPDNPDSAGAPLFQVTVNRPTSNYIAIADVDYYDGDGWSFTRTFRPSGGAIPTESDPSLRAPGPSVSQDYTIDAGPLTTAPWLPFLYRPQQVTGASVEVDTTSGMVVPSTGLHAGQRYGVRSTATIAPFTSLPASAAVATSAPPNYSTVPPAVRAAMATVVTSFERETGARSSTPVSFLKALATDLRAHYSLTGRPAAASASSSPAASPSASTATSTTPSTQAAGTSFANVLASILGPNRTATPEQYATLVALVARQIGVPARVVSGFRVKAPGSGPGMPAGTYRVTSGEAWTWVQIPIQGRGWVVLDASPSSYGAPRNAPSASARPSPIPTPTLTPNGLVTGTNRGGHAVAPKSKVPRASSSGGVSLTVVLIAVAVTLIVLVLLALLLRKRLRARGRRRSGDPRRRLLGAWQESLDLLSESGLPDLSALTGAEVAAATDARFGNEPAAQARYLGERANAAIFSPTSWIDPAEADAAWQAHTLLRRSVHRRMTLPERVGAGLRYRRRPRSRAHVAPSSWAARKHTRSGTSRRGH